MNGKMLLGATMMLFRATAAPAAEAPFDGTLAEVLQVVEPVVGIPLRAYTEIFDDVGSAFGISLNREGIFINAYSNDPNRRMEELLKQSEELRTIEHDWEHIWFADQPSHLTPERVRGGIQ